MMGTGAGGWGWRDRRCSGKVVGRIAGGEGAAYASGDDQGVVPGGVSEAGDRPVSLCTTMPARGPVQSATVPVTIAMAAGNVKTAYVPEPLSPATQPPRPAGHARSRCRRSRPAPAREHYADPSSPTASRPITNSCPSVTACPEARGRTPPADRAAPA